MNSMNILLIRPPNPLKDAKLLSHTKPMNLAYIASYLRKYGYSVYIIDYEVEDFSNIIFIDTLKEISPAVIGVSCMTPMIKSGARVCEIVKKFNRNIITVVGGSHANGLPKQTIEEFPAFDYLVYGEGEATFLELCNRIYNGDNVEDIKGIVYKRDGFVVMNQSRELIRDLDSIPFPARDLIKYDFQAGHSVRGFSNKILSTEIYTSRGCPYKCTFCAIQTAFGNKIRFRDTSYIEEEIKQCVRDFNFSHIIIADDTFTLKKSRAFEICEILSRNKIKSWNCDTKVNTISRELLMVMKQSGCKKVTFGVESGSQRIIDLIGKRINIDQVKNAVLWAKEAGIEHIEGNFIIGSDASETMEDIDLTRNLIRSIPWTFVSVGIIVPYPGTPVYDKMKAKNQVATTDWNDFVIFGKKPQWHTDHFSSQVLIDLQKKLTREFYLNPKYIFDRLMNIRSWTDVSYWVSSGLSYLNWYFTGKV